MTKTKARPKAPVTLRALIARINRKLAKDDEVLKVARGARAQLDLGDYYTVSLSRNYITGKHIDPEQYGRELEVLHDYEEVIE